MKLKKPPKESLKKLRLSEDFPWQLLNKIMSDIEGSVLSDHGTRALALCRAAVRKRDIQAYITYCKSCSSLRKLSTTLSASEHHQDDSDRNQLLSEIRALRLTTLFQKFDFPKSPIQKMDNAMKSFEKFESLCGKTNADIIFQSYKNDEDDSRLSTYDNIITCRVLRFAEEFILRIVGVIPDDMCFNNSLRHGPGATTDKRGNNSINIIKYMPPIGCSAAARDIFFDKCCTDARWHRANITNWLNGVRLQYDTDDERFIPFSEWLTKEVTHSAITFVPKDAEKLRTINIEPTANLYLQLGIDGIIRKRLKTVGINLDTQEKNQVLAQHASLHDDLVTMDLSGASDSIALIWLRLFPEPWARLLNALRMDRGIVNDREIVFNKLSAMGNGYTFVVETLLFSALFYGVLRVEGERWKDHIASSAFYGDDIIIPKRFYSTYSYVMHRLGFRENVEKTFSHGPFRESCGKDFFFGDRIDRPTVKSFPKEEYELVIIHNLLYDFSKRTGMSLENSLSYLVARCPKKFFGPYDNDSIERWLFSETPPYKPAYISAYQAFYYKLSAFSVTHPILYRKSVKNPTGTYSYITDIESLHKEYQVYYPLGWLSRHEPEFSHEDVNPRESSPSRSLFYLKKVKTVKIDRVLVPLIKWCSCNYSW